METHWPHHFPPENRTRAHLLQAAKKLISYKCSLKHKCDTKEKKKEKKNHQNAIVEEQLPLGEKTGL